MIRTTRTMAWLLGGVLLFGAAMAQAQDWPQWRGPNRDNHVSGFTEPKTWPKTLTKQWRVAVGEGESSPLMIGDKLYAFGRLDNNEIAMCFDAKSGKELWKEKFAAAAITGPAAKMHQGPRSTPAIGAGKLCTFGVRGVLSCYDAESGKLAWRKETAMSTKKVPEYYTSCSPLIADGKCVVFVDGGLTAFDLASGDIKWAWNAGTPYGSPNLITVDGVKQIVSPYEGGLVGVALADGKKLWTIDVAGSYQSNYSTPIVDGAMVYYSASGGKKGGGNTFALKIEKKGDGFSATEVWKNGLAAHFYNTPVVQGDLLVGSSNANTFFGVDVKSGKELWKDITPRGQCGSIVSAGSVFISMSSDKKLVAFKADNKAYTELASYTVADSGEPWSVPIIAGNRIYVKDKGGSLTLWTIE